MSVQELRELLERIEDTREIVLGPTPGEASRARAPLAVWRAARAEANAALETWRRDPRGCRRSVPATASRAGSTGGVSSDFNYCEPPDVPEGMTLAVYRRVRT